MDFNLFAVKFMVNCQSIYKLSDQKIKNIYFKLSKLFRAFTITCIQKLIIITNFTAFIYRQFFGQTPENY